MSHPKTARPDHPILDVIRDRWSPRAFDPARAVSRDELLRLFEAARWAPSSGNEQPWRFVVTARTDMPDAFDALARSLTGRNPVWARAAPVLVLVAVSTGDATPATTHSHACYDAGQAVGFLLMQATAMGLSVTCLIRASESWTDALTPPARAPVTPVSET